MKKKRIIRRVKKNLEGILLFILSFSPIKGWREVEDKEKKDVSGTKLQYLITKTNL